MNWHEDLFTQIADLLLAILHRSRLSRFFTVVFAILALVVFGYSVVASDSPLVGSLLAVGLAVLAVLTWKAGNWWAYKKALWKAQEGMPPRLKQRGFDVVATKPRDPAAR